MKDPFLEQRKKMVEEQLIRRGIKDEKVLQAFYNIPRHIFVPKYLVDYAYDDRPLSIGYGQTISQPYMVAIMTELLELDSKQVLLEIGSGSGYQAAIASMLAKFVYSIERIEALAEIAKENLSKLNIKNVEVIVNDGSVGYPDKAPYDKILYTAATPFIPDIIFDQLRINGYIVAPVGERYSQMLTKYIKRKERIEKYTYFGCIFVPLKGSYGFE